MYKYLRRCSDDDYMYLGIVKGLDKSSEYYLVNWYYRDPLGKIRTNGSLFSEAIETVRGISEEEAAFYLISGE